MAAQNPLQSDSDLSKNSSRCNKRDHGDADSRGSGGSHEIVANFPHEWRPAGIATWRCTQCGSMASACPAQPEGGACTGLPKAVVAKKGKGHVLWRFAPTPNSPFAAYICCQDCGASGSMLAWQHLSGTCTGKWTSSTTKSAWHRLSVGMHPHNRHKGEHLFFPGVPLPEGQAPAR